MGLAHRDRELGFPASVQLAEAGVAVAVRIALDVLVPEDRQRDVLALELAMDGRPLGLDLTPVTLFRGALEGSYVLFGAMFGLPADTALVISLSKRVRELALGVPGLLLWQCIEGRYRLRRGSPMHADQSTPTSTTAVNLQTARALGIGSAAFVRLREWVPKRYGS